MDTCLVNVLKVVVEEVAVVAVVVVAIVVVTIAGKMVLFFVYYLMCWTSQDTSAVIALSASDSNTDGAPT